MVISFFKYRKIYYTISSFLILLVFILLFSFGLNLGIDLKGGSMLEVEFLENIPETKDIYQKLLTEGFEGIIVQKAGEREFILRFKEMSVKDYKKIIDSLTLFGSLNELQFEMVGPTISNELREKSTMIILLSVFLISFYVMFAFSSLSKIVPIFICSLIVLFTLFHDVMLSLGVASILKIQISIPVIIAFLIIVGYSINNTVVVYDRFRDVMNNFPEKSLNQAIDEAISQTLSRQINTSLTTLFPLITIFFFVDELKEFALILMSGIIFGLYSSIFLALPLLGTFTSIFKKNN